METRNNKAGHGQQRANSLRRWAGKATDALLTRHGAKFTRAYWQERARDLKHYDYRQIGSRAFLRQVFKKAALWVPVALLVFYLLVYLGAFGRMPSYNALKGLQHNTASEVYSADGVTSTPAAGTGC